MTPAKKKATKSKRDAKSRAAPGSRPVDGEHAVLEKIAAMPEPYRQIGLRLHAIIRANAPGLTPRTWYGLPAYSKEKDVVCFFRGPQVFGERYLTLGFNDSANLDEGPMWPVQFALTTLTPADEAKIAALVRRAVT